MAGAVQLAPGSLALVLGKLDSQDGATAAGDPEEPGGRAVFRAFRRANARCFWNARLARAASRLAFQGWLRRGVLLVRAPPASLRVLRDAWRRRALRPPHGFRIRAVGDVFPVQMNLIAQSQFIPLAEVLCCAVSEMNAAQVAVTQGSLMEHLVKHHPGIAVPSQDMLYTTLGTLIKERKIYHTGDGYFIVTPQTYFITQTTSPGNTRVRPEERHPMPPSITYLVSMDGMDGSAELAREHAAVISHCQSCQCFPDGSAQGTRGPQTAAEAIRKDQKGPGESKLWGPNQAISVSEESHVCSRTKPSPRTKDRDKGKKFGFGLFWRNMSRKEKPKAEHRSFSAQFPPEEWPVRDEDNLDNIPRAIEHEIIKRINPILTVDNLIKHTVLMQKYEEQKKYNSQGTSTDRRKSHREHSPKERVKKRQGRSAKPHRQAHSHRERDPRKGRSQATEPPPRSSRQEEHPKLPATQSTPRSKSPNEVAQKPLGETPTVLGTCSIYKRQISNPFQGLPHRRSPGTRGHRSQKTSDLKPRPIGPKEKIFQRSRSFNSSRIFRCGTEQRGAERGEAMPKAESVHVCNPVSAGFQDGLPEHPQCRVLQVDSEGCCCGEDTLGCDACGQENELVPEVVRKSHSHLDKVGETEEAQRTLPSRDLSSFDQSSSACVLVAKTIQQFRNLDLLDLSTDVSHVRQPKRPDRDSAGQLMRKAFIRHAEPAPLEAEGLSDPDQAFPENEGEGDDGACSSLYLEEEEGFSENDDLCPMLPGHPQYSFPGESNWNHLGKQQVIGRSRSEYSSKTHSLEPQMLNDECYRSSGVFPNPGESQNPNRPAGSCDFNAGTRFALNYEKAPSVAKGVVQSALADGSIFDSRRTRIADAEAETLQASVGDTGKKLSIWSQSPQIQEPRNLVSQKLELFNPSNMPAQDVHRDGSHLELTENHSMAGDSGIDSPRTQSLASNHSVILEGLKRRPIFLQNFEGTKSSQALTPDSLLQLTPVINV
ncbi:storkhead-box protein 1 isoform X1 [Tenrec ecaudatus]|uniref:storkhead-box protein 1 isoform X1 n=1 Tax=Tenrec ecaudatus TaxID=94439 RepID=UPI003F597B1C